MEIKTPRFITEFANYQRKRVANDNLLSDRMKNDKINRINSIENRTKRGLLSISNCMQLLSKI